MTSILLIEDEISLGRIMESRLRAAFPTAVVLTARHADSAKELVNQISLAQGTVDIAIVDLRMPLNGLIDIDAGFTVAKEIQSRFPDVTILINSARGDIEAKQRCEASHYKYICKFDANTDFVEETRKFADNLARP